ncbi:hypothetical protein SNE40_012334 [Patella caerulea]|uniref:GON-4-like protein n=1 Tax=Patella caerulea TaxID=87958 RepID=A0AAN8JQQ8_PATCE
MSETLKTDDSLKDKDESDSVLAANLGGSGEEAALPETEEEMDTTPETDSKTASFTTDNSPDESNEGGTAGDTEGEMGQTNMEFFSEKLSSMIADKINTNKIKTKKKKEKTDTKSNDDDKVLDSEEVEDDSDASDVLCINQSDDEEDLENKLEERASRNNLTASNVKSILHQVITNKDVVEMVKNTLTIFEEAQSQDTGRTGNVYEPKMTRSKMKEVIEQGKMPQVWPLTPVKNNTRSKPSFLEMQFTDDEDEEYNPEKDKEAMLHDSDDESMLSSHASDFGSPCPQTPTTPSVNPVSTPSSDLFLSPQVPVKRSVKTDLGHAFNQASMSVNEENLGEFETDDTIARRTRSKLPLTTTSLSELESTFVAPDITEDMYDTLCDDSEWQEFLSSLITTDEVAADPQEINDDENNDPEYDYLGEAEHEEKDEEDYRFGRPYRIPKTEMLDLLNQLTEFMASDQEEEEEDKTDTGGDSTETEERHQRRKSIIMTDEFSTSQRLILEDQMRQHVQLSTQLYFLCLGSEDYSSMTEECYKHLHELDMFRQTSLAGSHSVFNACNLNCALELVTEERQWNLPEEMKDIESQSFDDSFSNGTDSEHEGVSVDSNVKKQKAKNKAFLESQKQIFWNSPVFMYPNLLPRRRLMSKEESDELRVFFSIGEDKLIVLGMDQFGSMPKNIPAIQKYLLPVKTVKQIHFRIKNKAGTRAGDNPIRNYKKYKILPENTVMFNNFCLSMMKAPKDQPLEQLPNWCKRYKEQLEWKRNMENAGLKHLEGDEGDKISPYTDQASDDSDREKSIPKKVVKKKRQPIKTLRKINKKGGKGITNPVSTNQPGASNVVLPRISQEPIPTALITSSGLYVPIRFASPSKLPINLQTTVVHLSPKNAVPVSQTLTATPEKMDASSSVPSYVINMNNGETPDGNLMQISNEVIGSVEQTPVEPNVDSVLNPVSSTPFSPSGSNTEMLHMPMSILPVSDSVEITSQSFVSQSAAQQLMNSTTPMMSSASVAGASFVSQIAPQHLMNTEAQITSSTIASFVLQSAPQQLLNTEASFVSHSTSQQLLNSKATVTSSATIAENVTQQTPVISQQKDIESSKDPKSSTPVSSSSVPNNIDESSQSSESKTIIAVPHHNLSGIVISTPVPSPSISVVHSPMPIMENDDKNIVNSDPKFITPSKLASDQPVNSPVDSTCSFITTPSSSNSSNVSSVTVSRNAVEIMATLAPYYNTYLATPAVSQQEMETTPKKKPRYRELIPKPGNFDPPSPITFKLSEPTPPKKPSPSMLKRQTRVILPKGFIHEAKISPTKRAANHIKKKAQKIYQKGASPSKILLPKPPHFVESPYYHNTRYQRTQREAVVVSAEENTNNSAIDCLQGQGDGPPIRRSKRKSSENEKMEESDDHQSEVEDGASASQDESQPEDELDDGQTDHLDELMAASTTIRFDPRKSSQLTSDTKTKSQKRKELNIAILASDILESDPKRDDRDTAFAQAYMHQVKEALLHDEETYEKFLLLMCEFGKGGRTPIQLYKDLTDLLKEFPDLIEDFAGFLRPDEAVACDCFTTNQEYQRANEFLRKLEINFQKQPTQFQRILKAFDKWQKTPNHTADQLKLPIRALLRGTPMLLQEFDLFFPEEKIRDCHADDYEDMNLSDSDFDDEAKFDGFEEVDVPDEYDTYRTKRCKCDCHNDPNDTKLQARLKHCYDCSLKNIDGGLYFQTSRNKVQPVRVMFHKLPESSSPSPPNGHSVMFKSPEELAADKENLNGLSPPLSTVRVQSTISPLKHCSLKKAKKMKLKTNKSKTGEKRFLSLTEITSPVKAVTSDDTGTVVGSDSIGTMTTASATFDQQTNVLTTNLTCPVTRIDITAVSSSSISTNQNNFSSLTPVSNSSVSYSKSNFSFIAPATNSSTTVSESNFDLLSSDFLSPATNSSTVVSQGNFSFLTPATSSSGAVTQSQEDFNSLVVSMPGSVLVTQTNSNSCDAMTGTVIRIPEQNLSDACNMSLSNFLDASKTSNFMGLANQESSKPWLCNDNSSDILAKALKVAEIPKDISMDSNFFRNLMNTPNKSQHPFSIQNNFQQIPNYSGKQLSFSGAVQPLNSSTIFTTKGNMTTTPVNSAPKMNQTCIDNSDDMDRSCDKKKEIFSENSVYIKSPEHQKQLVVGNSSEMEVAHDESSSVKGNCSADDATTWTRDTDKMILEMCQVHGTVEETFIVTAKKLGNKTPQEVASRFQTLMELLADSHGETDSEMSDDN